MKRVGLFVVNLGLAFILLYTGILVFVYIFALAAKIESPGMKNMNDHEAVVFGIVALILVVIDFFIIRWFIRQIKKRLAK